MHLKASVNYHVKSTQAQAFRFDADGIAGNLIAPELIATEVNVQDLRDKVCNVDFDDDGITFTKYPSAIKQFNRGRDWQTKYDEEITALLKRTISAQDVIVFDHTVRIDDPEAIRKPARNVHNDYSPKGANQRLIDLIGSKRASEYQKGTFGFVNIWRPIDYPITTSPLGFIRPNSMKPEDWMTIDLIYPDRKGEILGVAPNPQHEWFYQSNMQTNEVIIFNIYNNRGRPHLAHSALDIMGQPDSPLPRKSIETRTLVRYA